MDEQPVVGLARPPPVPWSVMTVARPLLESRPAFFGVSAGSYLRNL
jgi:hypothetical protein